MSAIRKCRFGRGDRHGRRPTWEFDPRKFLQAAIDKTKKVCIQRFEGFGCAGQAPKIRVIDLDAMGSATGAASCDRS
jgi:fructose-bisphosphate aldolase class II